MHLIDLTEELTFNIKHYDDSLYEDTLENFFNILGSILVLLSLEYLMF